MVTIFKKDTKGKIRYLKTWTEGAVHLQESGVVGTDKPLLHKTTCKTKNEGRSNETTPQAQAILEMESLVAQKIKEGYFQTQREAEDGDVMLPMLAKEYSKESKKIDWNNAYAQPKLDGMRALGTTTGIKSREGTDITTVPHIMKVLESMPNIAWDGELYSHGLTFQGNMRLAKKYRPGESEALGYHVYDLTIDQPFTVRYSELQKWVALVPEEHKGVIQIVPTYPVRSKAEYDKLHAKFLAEGYEGSILRWGDAGYKVNGRSSNLLKRKDFLDIALVIKDIRPADQRPEWGVPVFEWKGAKDDEVKAGWRMSHEEREDLLINKNDYIGKVAELRFFEYSEDGVPRHPVMLGVRLDKTKGDDHV